MAATSQNQLLDTQALCNKLSQAITPGNRILNAGDILSTWSGSVYLVGNLTSNRIPNNGEICPLRTYHYGTTINEAFRGSNVTVNVRNLAWDCNDIFDIDVNDTYFYNGSNVASNGYYMTIPSDPSTGCMYFNVTAAGLVTAQGMYYPHYFNWNSTGEDGWAISQLGSSALFTSNETRSSYQITNTYKGNVSGTVITDSSNTNASISTTSTGGSVTVSKRSVDLDYPFSFAVFSGQHEGITYYHGVLGKPADSFWILSASNLSVPFTANNSQSAFVTTNMGQSNYSLSKAGSENWISVNSDGQTLSILMNPNYSTRSATINVLSQFTTEFSVNNHLDGIEYISPSKSTSFTVTQESYPATVHLYVLVFRSSPEIMCISAASDSYVPVADGAPVRISVSGMKIQTDPTIGATIYTGSGPINTGSDTGLVRWFPILPSGSYIASINDYGTVSATNLPGYYTLDTQVHFLHGTFNG